VPVDAEVLKSLFIILDILFVLNLLLGNINEDTEDGENISKTENTKTKNASNN